MFISRAVLLVLIVSGCLSVIESAKFTSCSSAFKYGKLSSIRVSNCGPNDSACPFKAGQKVSMQLDYEVVEDFSTARIEIAGVLAGIQVPFKIRPSSVCHYGNCPIRTNSVNSVQIELPILAIYPKIKLTVQLSLIGPKKEKILCVQFPAQIVG